MGLVNFRKGLFGFYKKTGWWHGAQSLRQCGSEITRFLKYFHLQFVSGVEVNRSPEFGLSWKLICKVLTLTGWLPMLAKVRTSVSSPVWAIVLPRFLRLMVLSVFTVASVCLCRALSSTVPHTLGSSTLQRACCRTPRTHPSLSHGLLHRQVST